MQSLSYSFSAVVFRSWTQEASGVTDLQASVTNIGMLVQKKKQKKTSSHKEPHHCNYFTPEMETQIKAEQEHIQDMTE